MRTITVKGTGNVSARPDYIILSLNIEVLCEAVRTDKNDMIPKK